MTSRSEDYEKGTVVVCGADAGGVYEEQLRAPRREAENALRAQGYMRLIYAPAFFNLACAAWTFRFEPCVGTGRTALLHTVYNAWAPRWLVYSYAAACAAGAKAGAEKWMYAAVARSVSPAQAAEQLAEQFIKAGFYREASD